MSKTVTFAWGKFPLNLGLAIASLSLVTFFDIWSKLNWFGQFVMIIAILLLIFQPKISVESDNVIIRKDNNVEFKVNKKGDKNAYT